MGKFVDRFDERIQLTDKEHYRREQYQSYMTGPEWRNVEMAEEFAELLDNGQSMFHYPYFRQIYDLWKIVYHSYSSARKYNSISDILFSEYMLMDLFVATFTTLELIPKGIISLLLYPFLSKENNSSMQNHLAEYHKKYAQDLQTIPFYDHSYEDILEDLTKKYEECTDRTWVDWFSWKVISTELWMRQHLSKPLQSWFHQEGNEAPPTTDILVKFNALDAEYPEQAKQEFKERLEKIGQVVLVDEQLYAKDHAKNKNEQNYISVYARLRAPRYATFQPVVRALAEQNIHLRKIAGQDQVQVKCTIDAEDEDKLLATKEALNQTKKVTPLYSYSDRIHANHKICLFDVAVRNLHKTLDRLEKEENVTVNFIHNF